MGNYEKAVVLDFKEECRFMGRKKVADTFCMELKKKGITNIYGVDTQVYAECDLCPESDPVFPNISRRVALLLEDGRVLHECYYNNSTEAWIYLGMVVPTYLVTAWWYEEDRLFTVD